MHNSYPSELLRYFSNKLPKLEKDETPKFLKEKIYSNDGNRYNYTLRFKLANALIIKHLPSPIMDMPEAAIHRAKAAIEHGHLERVDSPEVIVYSDYAAAYPNSSESSSVNKPAPLSINHPKVTVNESNAIPGNINLAGDLTAAVIHLMAGCGLAAYQNKSASCAIMVGIYVLGFKNSAILSTALYLSYKHLVVFKDNGEPNLDKTYNNIKQCASSIWNALDVNHAKDYINSVKDNLGYSTAV